MATDDLEGLIPPGGFHTADPASQEAAEAAAFAVAAQSTAMATRLELVSIVGIQRQTVAGVNYEITLTVQDGAEQKTAEAKVFKALGGPPTYRLTAWTWQ